VKDPDSKDLRVLRGGGWSYYDIADTARSVGYFWGDAAFRGVYVGFRTSLPVRQPR
jgi:formylglycine-generating enzyme required for sulfatase activity